MGKNINSKLKNQKGITILSLVITIIVLSILAGITINMGLDSIDRAELDELKTNMLLVEAKAKQLVEEANFKVGIVSNPITPEQQTKIDNIRQEIYVTNNKLQLNNETNQISGVDLSKAYILTVEAKKLWGLEGISEKTGEYLIVFDEVKDIVQVYNTKGYDNCYSLEDIKNYEIYE